MYTNVRNYKNHRELHKSWLKRKRVRQMTSIYNFYTSRIVTQDVSVSNHTPNKNVLLRPVCPRTHWTAHDLLLLTWWITHDDDNGVSAFGCCILLLYTSARVGSGPMLRVYPPLHYIITIDKMILSSPNQQNATSRAHKQIAHAWLSCIVALHVCVYAVLLFPVCIYTGLFRTFMHVLLERQCVCTLPCFTRMGCRISFIEHYHSVTVYKFYKCMLRYNTI